MPKKIWTDQERQAFGEKMRARRLAKQQAPATPELPLPAAPLTTTVDEVRDGVSQEEYQALLRRFSELEANLRQPSPSQSYGPQVNQRGSLIGTFEKYLVDPDNYTNPAPRLLKEPKLSHLAFELNYDFEWEVKVTSYQTQDGINTKEPQFNLNLLGIIRDEDTGEATNQRYIYRKLIFHEDPQAALVVARDHGIDVASLDQVQFLNEMRYLRCRDWLLDIFFPGKAQSKTNKREVVIGNQLVEVFEINSEKSESVPFHELTNKLR